MVGGGNKNKNKSEEKAESIKIKDFLISNTCKICIICFNKYECRKKKIKTPILFSGRA